MYHHVGLSQTNSKHALFISTERFAAQIRFLARRGYVGIRPSDWLSWIRYGTLLPKRPILITFDDAFEDLHDQAFPVLASHGFSAAVFVVTNCIGKANIWDQPPQGYARHQCLTAEQIRHWSRKGIEFGAHSRNHPDLTTLAEAELLDEVAGSRSDLENVVGLPVISFAYPYGSYNSTVADCVGHHFDLGFATEGGLNTSRTDRRMLRRDMVFASDTLIDLEWLVRSGWAPIRHLRRRLRRSRFQKMLRYVSQN
jgi:peptidoglycan/xylan/chitin deacetylase (PgdA/CDA1 family)